MAESAHRRRCNSRSSRVGRMRADGVEVEVIGGGGPGGWQREGGRSDGAAAPFVGTTRTRPTPPARPLLSQSKAAGDGRWTASVQAGERRTTSSAAERPRATVAAAQPYLGGAAVPGDAASSAAQPHGGLQRESATAASEAHKQRQCRGRYGWLCSEVDARMALHRRVRPSGGQRRRVLC